MARPLRLESEDGLHHVLNRGHYRADLFRAEGKRQAGCHVNPIPRVLSNSPIQFPVSNLFHRGFVACDSYANGEAAMARVQCPVLFLLGRSDAMAPPKAAQSLQAKARDDRTVVVEAGHQMITEAPDAVLFAVKDFLQS